MIPDEQVEAMLRHPTRYIDDGGFTAGVIERLPPRRSTQKQRAAIIGVFTALAVVVALATPVAGLLQEALSPTSLIQGDRSLALVGWVMVALIVWAAVGLARTEEA